MRKLLRVSGPRFVAGAEVYYNKGHSSWGNRAPYLRRVIGNMTVAEFMQYLNGIARNVGLSYEWVDTK